MSEEKPIVIEMPTDEMQRYVALANLKKLNPALGTDHTEEFWHIIRSLAVLDWTLIQPEHGVDNAEERFRTIMRKVQQLALQIQTEQGYTQSEKPN